MRVKRQNRKGVPGRIISPLLAFALAAGFIIGTPPLSGEAWAVELDKECTLQIHPVMEGSSVPEGQVGEKVDVAIDLYLVAEAREVDGFDTYDYYVAKDSPCYGEIAAYVGAHEGEGWEFQEDGEGLIFRFRADAANAADGTGTGEGGQEQEGDASDIAASEGMGDNFGWAGFARAAASAVLAEDSGMQPAAAGEAGSRIQGLKAGLYLTIARGRELTEKKDYVKEIENAEGGTETATIAYSQEYVYQFIPQLVSLPGKETEGGSMTTAGQGEWVYELYGAELKPIVDSRYTSLEIVKTLNTYAEPASFVFQVEASLQGRVIYSDVVTMSFDGSSGNTKSVMLENRIPAGADVTVREIYSGAGYELTGLTAGAGSGEVQEGTGYSTDLTQNTAVITSISAESTEGETGARVTFINDYNGSGNGGGAITNHFERQREEADWSWNQFRYDPAAGSWSWNAALPAVADTTVR